jgi:hypothetical protein
MSSPPPKAPAKRFARGLNRLHRKVNWRARASKYS